MIRLRLFLWSGVAILIASVPPIVATCVAGQEPAAAAATYTPGRTPWGDPDLQGVFDFQSDVPFQRPLDLGNKTVFASPEERRRTGGAPGSIRRRQLGRRLPTSEVTGQSGRHATSSRICGRHSFRTRRTGDCLP